MGMFDYIKSEMPLPEDAPRPAVEWFQTKDVPSEQLYLEKWVIRADGKLLKLGVRYEDRSNKNAPAGSWESIAGTMTPVPDPASDRVFEDFHGEIMFGHYDHKTEEDWDYTARFTDGICTRITVEYTPPVVVASSDPEAQAASRASHYS
jgi:hypothetical protein